MSTLVIELPDEHLTVLERLAHERGISIEAVVADLVTTIAAQDVHQAQSNGSRDSQQNMVSYLLEHPYRTDAFTPLTRDELYERG